MTNVAVLLLQYIDTARKIKRIYKLDIKDALANKPFEISLLCSEPKPKIINTGLTQIDYI